VGERTVAPRGGAADTAGGTGAARNPVTAPGEADMNTTIMTAGNAPIKPLAINRVLSDLAD
jgi:hypothetical protein